ncbi:ABC transporter ATP-binding protein [Planosporangium flavigriseum]|nr:ATP-binding cassette domain-containing protein [Planosporangium flavigriseum]NJC63141.1 ABC transporter ATP-binding protein [Planosporangium flavigriseum]
MRLSAESVTKTFGKTNRLAGKSTAVRAVDSASVHVEPGDFVAIVGESGSGKSTLARMLLGLIPADSGVVQLDGVPISAMNRRQRQQYRAAVQCVLQDPSGSLNPRKTVRTSLAEVIRFHGIAQGREAVEQKAIETLSLVGLKPETTYLDRYPHELSGGQRQRVLIARAIVPNPRIIIADEAVSALDVSVKSGILKLMNDLRVRLGIGYILITHDLPVVKKVADYVYVIKSGQVVEEGPTAQIFADPQHEYTKTLLAAAPDLDLVLADRFGE